MKLYLVYDKLAYPPKHKLFLTKEKAITCCDTWRKRVMKETKKNVFELIGVIGWQEIKLAESYGRRWWM